MKLFKLIQQTHTQDYNLAGAIEEVLDEKCRNSSLVEEGKPFKWFPNVQSVRMELSPMDLIFKLFNITKRESKAKMHYKKYRNKKMNRFALWQIRRMKKAIQKNDQLYGTMADILIRRSRIFFMLALKHVYPKGHRDYPFWQILALYKKFRIITKEGQVQLDYKRVYIPKANGKGRPLGVPKPEGRIYLHLVNQFLVMRLDGEISPSQHGFRPGRGTMTAWKEILQHVNKYNYIYEFDYKNFFNSLDVCSVSKTLETLGVPEEGINKLEAINSCIPKLTEEDLVDEEYYHTVKSRKPKPGIVDSEYRALTGTPGREKPFRNEELYETENGGARKPIDWGSVTPINIEMSLDEITRFQGRYHINNLKKFKDLHVDEEGGISPGAPVGLPQGSPTSPFLSALTLSAYANDEGDRDLHGIRYADDGVVMSNEPRNILTETTVGMHMSRIEYSPEKSGGVKYNGKGLKPLKFLGMEFDGSEWRANTREGSKLIFDKHSLLTALKLMQREYPSGEGRTEHPDSWMKFTMSTYFGFFMSRLYIGEGNLGLDYVQNFRLKYVKGSGCDNYNKGLNSKRGDTLLRKLTGIKLTVFNSTSLSYITALEALKEFEERGYKQMKHNGHRKLNIVLPEVPKEISEGTKLTEFFYEQHPIASAAIGRGPIINGPYSSRTQEANVISVKGISKRYYIIGFFIGIIVGGLTMTNKSQIITPIGYSETVQQIEFMTPPVGGNPGPILMLIGITICVMSVFLPAPGGGGLNPGNKFTPQIEPSITGSIYGPLTKEQMDIVKGEMHNQAFLDNLTISPIGELFKDAPG